MDRSAPNPAAGLKLVNNLDLVVTNLVTGEVFLGNDFAPGSGFSQPWTNGAAPNLDVVNNVENVYLSPSSATNYSVTVVARGVNVNAVTPQTNRMMQDYALVISSGDGQVEDALTITNTPVVSFGTPTAMFITNAFAAGQGISGGCWFNQRVGTSDSFGGRHRYPWPVGSNGVITAGLASQWRFYVLTNNQDYTNAAFASFLPVDLSLPRLGVNQTNLGNATRAEATSTSTSRPIRL